MNYHCYVALISCFVVYVVGCGGGADQQPQEKHGRATSKLVTGAGSPAPGEALAMMNRESADMR